MRMGRAWIAVAFSLVLTSFAAYSLLREAPSYHGMLLEPPLPAREFTLQGAAGPLGTEQLRGSYAVLFFGYTSCPDVCPTTLARLAASIRQAGPRAEREVRVVMVSVDPERDTAARLAAYTSAFGPQFQGVTGAPEEIARVASAYGIAYMRSDTETAAGYLVDHTSTLIVLDPQGRMRLLWSPVTTVDEMASDLRTLLGR
jgi:protein SCO1